VSLLNLIRWGGLAAMIAGVLFIVADLATLLVFVLTQAANEGALLFRSIAALSAGILLLLGLVGLYARQSEAIGILGLVAFLVAFVGSVLQRDFVWASMLAKLGWALFGAVSLDAGVYPQAAAVLLIIGAVLSGVINGFLANTQPVASSAYFVSIVVFDIIFYASVAWLGSSLFMGRSQEGS